MYRNRVFVLNIRFELVQRSNRELLEPLWAVQYNTILKTLIYLCVNVRWVLRSKYSHTKKKYILQYFWINDKQTKWNLEWPHPGLGLTNLLLIFFYFCKKFLLTLTYLSESRRWKFIRLGHWKRHRYQNHPLVIHFSLPAFDNYLKWITQIFFKYKVCTIP